MQWNWRPLFDFEDALIARLDARAAIAALDARDRGVIAMRFRDGLTYHEAGARLRVSHERVRQIEERALRTLRVRLRPPPAQPRLPLARPPLPFDREAFLRHMQGLIVAREKRALEEREGPYRRELEVLRRHIRREAQPAPVSKPAAAVQIKLPVGYTLTSYAPAVPRPVPWNEDETVLTHMASRALRTIADERGPDAPLTPSFGSNFSLIDFNVGGRTIEEAAFLLLSEVPAGAALSCVAAPAPEGQPCGIAQGFAGAVRLLATKYVLQLYITWTPADGTT